MIFMDSRKPLYRHSLKEAVRHEEKDLWRESYKISCDCARAIERSIAENYDGKKLGPDLAEPIIQQYGFNRVNWVLANTVQQKKEDGRISPENRQWAETFPIPQEEHSVAIPCVTFVLRGIVLIMEKEFAEEQKN